MINQASRPIIRADLQQADLKDGSVLYDKTRETTYTLNLTASLIWSYLDGGFSLEEIAGEVSSIHGADSDTILKDVIETVRLFQKNGLLVPATV